MTIGRLLGRYFHRLRTPERWNGPAHTPIERLPMVAIDTETTGLDARRDRLLSFAAVRIEPGLEAAPSAEIDVLVDPGVHIPARATAVHGIDHARLAGAPTFAEVHGRIAACLSGTIVVGHFVAFDLAILGREAARAHLPWREPPSFDTAALASAAGYPAEHLDIVDILERLGIEPRGQRHTASGDARMAADLFIAIARRLIGQGRGTYAGAVAAHPARRR
jgi:DNA polymerase-3 subunit epsilon